ncbi:MAG: holin family protein [Rickettsiales bacterium]|nr:holin family protein [Rickettsiales bacterium]
MTAWLALIPAVSELLDKIIPDPDARDRAKMELLKEQNAQSLQQLQLAAKADENQTTINAQEATNPNLFVSGWRPFIGWVCGVAFAYHFVLQPFLCFVLINRGIIIELPQFRMDELTTVLMGLLGLGGLRTLEKIKNVA